MKKGNLNKYHRNMAIFWLIVTLGIIGFTVYATIIYGIGQSWIYLLFAALTFMVSAFRYYFYKRSIQ